MLLFVGSCWLRVVWEKGFRVQVGGFMVVVRGFAANFRDMENMSPLGEGAGRRPGIECLEEAQFYVAIRMPTVLRLFLVTKNLCKKSDADSLFTDT